MLLLHHTWPVFSSLGHSNNTVESMRHRCHQPLFLSAVEIKRHYGEVEYEPSVMVCRIKKQFAEWPCNTILRPEELKAVPSRNIELAVEV